MQLQAAKLLSHTAPTMCNCGSCRPAVACDQLLEGFEHDLGKSPEPRAECSPHCSVLLCKKGSQQAVCHCSYTYGDLLFIQMCSDPAPMYCNTVFGKRHSPLFSAALQNRLTAGSVSLQIHLWRFGLHTDVQ